MFRIAPAVIVFALSCCSFASYAQGTKPAKPPLIRSIEVRGPLHMSVEMVSAVSGLTPGLRATAGAIETGRLLILESGERVPDEDNFLRSNLVVRTQPVPDNPGLVDVVFEVPEQTSVDGRPRWPVALPTIRGVIVTGTGPVPLGEVLAQIRTKPGVKADAATLHADVDRIRKYYDVRGYIAMAVGRIGYESGMLDLPVQVSRIRRMRFVGLRVVPETTVRKHISLKVGDYYNSRTLKKDSSTLLRLGLFANVHPDVLTPGAGEVELVLRFEEKAKRMP